MAVAFIVALEPQSTGQYWHEWLGIGFGVAVIVHILLSWKWVVSVTRRFFGKTSGQARINYLLNLVLLLAMGTVVVSGLIISRNLPIAETLGVSSQTQHTWEELHRWSPQVALLVLGVHLGLHWKWIVATIKRYTWKPRRRIAPQKALPELSTRS
ncbi:MAG TPA: DUF4405 domain-containing protein [Aggregatilinea sp.]|nr:DUF4405 domain-containing protein [Aggregatilinea sp.]